MTTALADPPAPRLRFASLFDVVADMRADEVVYLTGLSWAEFRRLHDACEAHEVRRRYTYDRGRLELMTTSFRHERWKKVLAALLERFATDTGRRFVGAGNMSVARQDLDRGFLPDECYYVQSVDRVADRDELDLTRDPPPDLMIEVEATRTVIPRLPVIAAFRIPEVWRYDGQTLTVLHLRPDGEYAPAATSLAFPELPVAELARFLALAGTTDQGNLTRQFADWVRATFPGPTP